MSERSSSLLVEILSRGDKNIVESTTDETFDKAVDLSAKDFGRVFEKRSSSHAGFSAGVRSIDITKR